MVHRAATHTASAASGDAGRGGQHDTHSARRHGDMLLSGMASARRKSVPTLSDKPAYHKNRTLALNLFIYVYAVRIKYIGEFSHITRSRYLVNPPSVVRRMPVTLQRLIGFAKAGNSLGMLAWDSRGSVDPLAAVDQRWDPLEPAPRL